MVGLNCAWIYFIQYQTAPLHPQVAKETAICHIWHYDGDPWSSIHTHSQEGHYVWVIEGLHLEDLIHHALNIIWSEESCMHTEEQD